ncbi:uncharacterized protein EDB91DRAFT_1166676 [Suillus paluster]|uniref:uncharacterized protein n=1 Tax=Suillus paluster TaxID=48578 RepID=UPI001B871C2B|nr:uncharacterized protein EDB91DRAFT_1166676 [Suillus paluster]KAG1726050.1 hypothetical protein EDB91DRAFT_1166676 [Suillus paluster]
MARTRIGGKRKGPRDPTKEARIQAAIQDTLTGVHGSFRSAASYKRKEDLEALAGALGLSRDGKIADLAARIKAHLEDPDTRTALADNPRFSALYGSKRRTGRPVADLPLPTQLRMKTQHLQQVLLSPRQPTICSTRSHHFFRKCKDLSPFLIRTTYIMLAPLYSQQPLLSYLHHHSHCCLGILIVSLFITPATRNTYSIRLLHTSHWYTRIYLPNI